MAKSEKPWYEKARLKFWYWSVAGAQGLHTDYSLDVRFAVRETLKPQQGKFRRRVFEWIRKSAREPRGGSPDMRTMAEILEAVDAHPDFRGTAAIFHSRLWELLALRTISLSEILKRIDDAFLEYGVERYSMPQMEPGWRSKRNPDFDFVNPINPIEFVRLQGANLDAIEWQYLVLLTYLFSRTTVLSRSIRLRDHFSRGLVNLFLNKNEEFGREFEPYLMEWIRSIQVVRVFDSSPIWKARKKR